MIRATETANIILSHFPDNFPSTSCSMIEEGPPYPPVPENKEWRPSQPVSWVPQQKWSPRTKNSLLWKIVISWGVLHWRCPHRGRISQVLPSCTANAKRRLIWADHLSRQRHPVLRLQAHNHQFILITHSFFSGPYSFHRRAGSACLLATAQ